MHAYVLQRADSFLGLFDVQAVYADLALAQQQGTGWVQLKPDFWTGRDPSGVHLQITAYPLIATPVTAAANSR